jgi:hypothetical protein
VQKGRKNKGSARTTTGIDRNDYHHICASRCVLDNVCNQIWLCKTEHIKEQHIFGPRCVQEKVCYQITTDQGTTYLFSYMCARESLLPDLAVQSTHERNKDSIDTASGRSCAGKALT